MWCKTQKHIKHISKIAIHEGKIGSYTPITCTTSSAQVVMDVFGAQRRGYTQHLQRWRYAVDVPPLLQRSLHQSVPSHKAYKYESNVQALVLQKVGAIKDVENIDGLMRLHGLVLQRTRGAPIGLMAVIDFKTFAENVIDDVTNCFIAECLYS